MLAPLKLNILMAIEVWGAEGGRNTYMLQKTFHLDYNFFPIIGIS